MISNKKKARVSLVGDEERFRQTTVRFLGKRNLAVRTAKSGLGAVAHQMTAGDCFISSGSLHFAKYLDINFEIKLRPPQINNSTIFEDLISLISAGCETPYLGAGSA